MPYPSTVTMTDEEHATLETFVHRGKANAHTLTRARILLKSAEGWGTTALAEALGVLPPLRKPWMCAKQPSRMCGDASPKVGWERSCTTKCSSTGAALSLACRRHIWSPSPVAPHPMGMTTGPCVYWPKKRSNWASCRAVRPIPFTNCLKKRTQTLAARTLVPPFGRQGVCGRDGRRAGPLRRTL
jgi:hypothetical protein